MLLYSKLIFLLKYLTDKKKKNRLIKYVKSRVTNS